MRYLLQRKVWFGLTILLIAVECHAQSIRVTSWNLEAIAAEESPLSNQVRIAQAAAVLKQADPDVVLLQNVPDWKTADGLVKALKPVRYNLIVCSAFRDGTNAALARRQVAILSKYRAYFSRSEAWQTGERKNGAGGFAFAAMRIANQPFGFYSIELPSEMEPAVDLVAGQLLAHSRTVQGWEANKLDATVAAGTFGSKAAGDTLLSPLAETGFGNPAVVALPEGADAAAPDFVLSEPPGIVGAPKVTATPGFMHRSATYDVEVEPAKLIAARKTAKARLPVKVAVKSPPANQPAKLPLAAAPVVTTAPPTNAPVQAQATTSDAAPAPPISVVQGVGIEPKLLAAAGAAGVLLLLGTGWLLLRRGRRVVVREPKQLAEAAGASSYTIIVGKPSATGSATVPDAGTALPPRPLVHMDPAGSTQTQTELLRRRAQGRQEIHAGVISHLSEWLKQKLVRKLVADRNQLMETQHTATLKALAVEERLAKIEIQISLQNEGYQQRIEDLTRELIAAKEENRELIRSQIRQVKAEMEAARARMLAQAKEPGEE